MNYIVSTFAMLLVVVSTLCVDAKPTSMRVDYIRTPESAYIRSEEPIFSWCISQDAKSQRAYEIIISKSAKCRKGDVWSSGVVESDNSSCVTYAGDKLEVDQRYFWRVRYWDDNNKKSRYSKPQGFRTAAAADSVETAVSANPLLWRQDECNTAQRVGEGEYLFDFERAAFGTLSFDIKASKKATLTFRVGEQLTTEGRIERSPKGTIRYQEISVDVKAGESIYDVIFAVDKRNTGHMAIPVPEEWGVIMPFRYVEVCGVDESDVGSIALRRGVMFGYREPLGSFSSSNEVLDSIWEICRYTIEATDFLGYYIDGDRERIPYEADAYINQLSHYCVDSEYAIGKRTLEYFMSNATWPTEWLLHTIMIAYQDYIYTGDTRLIAKYYDMLKSKTLYELAREDGLINAKSERVTPEYLQSIGFQKKAKRMADIVDWPMAAFTKEGKEMGERDGHDMRAINTVVNSFYYQALVYMAEIADVTGHNEDGEFFGSQAAKVRRTINEKLFDSERGVYIDGEGSDHSSLHSNMLPLAFGIVEGECVKSVVEFVKSRGMACSVYGAQYLFEALYRAGEAQYALDLMTNRSDRGWYNMIRVGSTMTLEGWDIKYKGNLDWNHAWGAAPANLIPRCMWGVTPTSAAFKSGVVRPQLADLKHSEISVPTLQGVIKCSYTNNNGSKRYEVDMPANMTLRFESAESKYTTMSLNGVEVSSGAVDLVVGKNIILVE